MRSLNLGNEGSHTLRRPPTTRGLGVEELEPSGRTPPVVFSMGWSETLKCLQRGLGGDEVRPGAGGLGTGDRGPRRGKALDEMDLRHVIRHLSDLDRVHNVWGPITNYFGPSVDLIAEKCFLDLRACCWGQHSIAFGQCQQVGKRHGRAPRGTRRSRLRCVARSGTTREGLSVPRNIQLIT